MVEEVLGVEHDSAPQKAMKNGEKLDEVIGTTLFVNMLEGNWDIHNCVQFHVHTKFPRSSLAGAHIFLEHVSRLPKEGL